MVHNLAWEEYTGLHVLSEDIACEGRALLKYLVRATKRLVNNYLLHYLLHDLLTFFNRFLSTIGF